MFTLLTIPPAFGLRNPSPFCLKLETLLTMGDFAFETEHPARPDKAPKGKLPALRFEDGHTVGDSALLQGLLERDYGASYDEGLTAAQLGEAQAYRTMVEEHLYFAIVYARWFDAPDLIREQAFASVPKLMRGFVFGMVQKKLRKALDAQGLGRHNRDEIYAFGLTDLRALETRLSGKEFFFGDRVTSIDAAIYGALHGLARGPFENPLTAMVQASPTLLDYERRVDAAVYGAPADGENRPEPRE